MATHPNYMGRDYWLDPGNLYADIDHDPDCEDDDCEGDCYIPDEPEPDDYDYDYYHGE